jgi:hypothetical protein
LSLEIAFNARSHRRNPVSGTLTVRLGVWVLGV